MYFFTYLNNETTVVVQQCFEKNCAKCNTFSKIDFQKKTQVNLKLDIFKTFDIKYSTKMDFESGKNSKNVDFFFNLSVFRKQLGQKLPEFSKQF